MDKEIPFNEYKHFKNYQIYCSYYLDDEDDSIVYCKMKIFYKDKEIYSNDLYGEDKYRTEEIYNCECTSHQRMRRLNKLLK